MLASENRKVRVEGAATAMLGADGWVVDAAEAVSYKISVSDEWELRGRLVEVKSEKDNAWTEQRIWIRSLTEPGFINYDNPYLFDGERAPVVDISICKVRDQRAKPAAKRKKAAEASTSKQLMGTDADFADEPPRPKAKAKKEAPPKKAAAKKRDDQAKPAAKRKAKAKDEGGEKKRKGKELAAPQAAGSQEEPVLVDSDSDDDGAKKRKGEQPPPPPVYDSGDDFVDLT